MGRWESSDVLVSVLVARSPFPLPLSIHSDDDYGRRVRPTIEKE